MQEKLTLTIHRGCRQVGGSCVELSHLGRRVIIDAGMPLDAKDLDAAGVLPGVPGLFVGRGDEAPVDGLVISHAHQDHYGLLDRVRGDVPVYMSEGAEKLIGITRLFNKKQPLAHAVRTFRWRAPFAIGPFTITPHLVDHSAFDAFALEVEAGGRRVFYSGDFREHGPIGKTMDILAERVAPGVDALVMEGTMLGRLTEETITEEELAARAEEICGRCRGAVLVCQSGQNVSRAVSFFKAARRTGREYVLDYYTAHVLRELGPLAGGGRLPYPGHPTHEGVYVWFPYHLTRKAKREGFMHIPNRLAPWKRTKQDIAARPASTMLYVRAGMEGDLARIPGLAGSTLVYSLWEGYKQAPRMAAFLRAVEGLGVQVETLHTSGHATVGCLQRLVDVLRPKRLMPIHTAHPEGFARFGARVHGMEDGVAVEV